MKAFPISRNFLPLAAVVALAAAGSAAFAWAAPVKTGENATAAKASTLVDLNTASKAELENVPGIGSAYAKKIIAHRPYAGVNDLSKSGIPAASVEKILPLVMVKSRQPVDLNTASVKELEEVPGIGSAYAKKIIAHRPYASANDLSNAGIPASRLEKILPLVTVNSKASTGKPRPAVAAAAQEANGSTGATNADNAPAARTRRSAGRQETASAPATPPEKGMVWANPSSKVYHVEGDRWYGKTKHGQWMKEDEAVKAGYHKAK